MVLSLSVVSAIRFARNSSKLTPLKRASNLSRLLTARAGMYLVLGGTSAVVGNKITYDTDVVQYTNFGQ